MHILIVDDEPRSAFLLKSLVEKFYETEAGVTIVTTAKAALESIEMQPPDLLLLDVEINGKSVFDLLDKIPVRDFPFIITSASREFAYQAFEYGSRGYVLKPINEVDLFSTLRRLSFFPPVIQSDPPVAILNPPDTQP